MHPGEILGTAAVLFVVVAAAGVWLSIYNSLVALKNRHRALVGQHRRAAEAAARRAAQAGEDLRGLHAARARGVRQAERGARGAATARRAWAQRAEAENLLTRALGGVFAVAEAYPDLKANQSFLQLQSRISELEGQIADRREFYNDTVATFNTRLGQIPDKWVAGWLQLVPADSFHAEARGPRGRRDQVRARGLTRPPDRSTRPPVVPAGGRDVPRGRRPSARLTGAGTA